MWELRATLGRIVRESGGRAGVGSVGWKSWRLAEVAAKPAPVLVDPFAGGQVTIAAALLFGHGVRLERLDPQPAPCPGAGAEAPRRR